MAEETALITLEQVKIAKGVTDNDAARDARYEQAIEFASTAVRKYADRLFGIPLVKETRSWEYDSSGYLDIDDAATVEGVVFVFGGLRMPITTFYWRAEPQGGPVYSYLNIPHWAGIYSPEMGFTYNLDVISKDRGWPGLIPLIEVTATWGWPTVPLDVQQATILTALEFADIPDNFVSENISGSSYSYQTAIRVGSGSPGGGANDLLPSAIPGRAQDLLAPYVRFLI